MLVFWAVIWIWVFLEDERTIVITEWDLAVMGPVVDNRQTC